MNLCASCGRQFEASTDTEALCPGCASTPPSARFAALPSEAARSRLRLLLQSPTIVLIGLNTLIYLLMCWQGRAFLSFDSGLLERWGANSGALTSGGQWWRLLASTFLHGGLLHIALNMWCLYSLGWLAELLFGRSRFTLLYLMCGLGGSLGSICWRGNGLSVGASGAIFGIAGALIPAMMLHGNRELRLALKGQLTSIAIFVVFNLAFGATFHGIDNAAHVGGLVTGLILGAFFPTGPERRHARGQLRAAAGMLLMIAVFCAAGAFARHRNQGYIESDAASDAYQRGDFTSAIAHAQRGAALVPQDAHAQFMLGAMLLEQHRYAEAIAPLTATAQLSPDFGPAYVNLCGAELELKQRTEALANCEKGAQLSPGDSTSWFNLGRARYAANNLAGARQALAKAVALNPQGFDENLQYALLLIEGNDSAKALPYLQKAHNLQPEDEDVTRMLKEVQGE